MSGTKQGGISARDTNRAQYGADFYKRIGAKGGRVGTTGGFYANRELARTAGRIGGLKSRRGKAPTLEAIGYKPIVDEDQALEDALSQPLPTPRLFTKLKGLFK